jgi:uncharacterized membrane protein
MRNKIAGLLSLVALCACAAPPSIPPAPTAYPAGLRLNGTEPFWAIDLDGQKLTYSSVAEPEKRTASIARSEVGGKLLLTGSLAGRTMTVTIAREQCSDGMSDRIYAYSANVTYGDEALKGCADRR